MSERSTYTSVLVRAQDIVPGEVVAIGGLCFTRLAEGMPLSKHGLRQKARYVVVRGVDVIQPNNWIEVKFLGGNCPADEREMYALFRPCELVRVQVEKQ